MRDFLSPRKKYKRYLALKTLILRKLITKMVCSPSMKKKKFQITKIKVRFQASKIANLLHRMTSPPPPIMCLDN